VTPICAVASAAGLFGADAFMGCLFSESVTWRVGAGRP